MSIFKKYKLHLLLTSMILVIAVAMSGQMRKDLESRRKKLAKDIKETQTLLKNIQKNKASTLDEYQTLKAEINKRTELINTIKAEIDSTESSINHTQDTILQIKEDLNRYQGDYAQMMRHAYRHRNANKRVLFILSAQNFNDAMRRWQYFVRYDQQRKKQITLVGTTQNALNQKLVILRNNKEAKGELLIENEQQQEELTETFEKQEKLLAELKTKETSIKKDLEAKTTVKERLSDAIDNAIRMDMKRAQETARNREKGVATPLTKDDKKVAAAFRKARGRLPKPVKGVITGKYGLQSHPTLKRLKIKNNGIDIKTYKDSKVKSIFKGQVTNVFSIPGSQNAVMIKHGNYYSVYSNLNRVLVKKGQQVNQHQVIAEVGVSSKTKQPELHLEIWKDNKHLNPQKWLKR